MGKNDKQYNKAPGGQTNAKVDEATAEASATAAQIADAATAQSGVQNAQDQIEQATEGQQQGEQSSDGSAGGDSAPSTESTESAPTPPVTDTPAAPIEDKPAAPEEAKAEDKVEDKPVGSIVDVPRPIGLQRNSQDAGLLNSFAHQLDEYCAKMGRAVPVTAIDGAAHQLALYRLICTILRQEGTVFTKAWSIFLQKVHEQADGAFAPNRTLRFFEHLKLDAAAKTSFQHLLSVAMATADPKGRAVALRTIEIPPLTVGLPVEGATEKLMAFYAP